MIQNQAAALCEAVLKAFYLPGGPTLREYAPPAPGDRDSCFLFSYFGTTGMLYHACKAGLCDLALYRQMVDGLAFYRAAPLGEGRSKYHAERGDAPGGSHDPCFFDDNIWVARNLLFAHELLGDAAYLAEAQRVVRYTYTAWNEALGGLVWNENGLGENGTAQELERGLSANACSILVNAQLYELTGAPDYLQWALKFYAFCKTVQDPNSKMYYNGVHTLLENGSRRAGAVNRDLYAYNPGSMILADLALHRITGDASYFEDAELAATAAHPAFLREGKPGEPPYYKDFVWFLTILAEAALALAAKGSRAGDPILSVFRQSLDYAWDQFRTDTGLLPHDYVTGWRAADQQPEYDRLLLTHCGTAEIAVLLFLHGAKG